MPGSHGSMTKAGRVRDKTPLVKRTGVNSKRKKDPIRRYKDLYKKRIVKKEFGGQSTSINARRNKHENRKRKEVK